MPSARPTPPFAQIAFRLRGQVHLLHLSRGAVLGFVLAAVIASCWSVAVTSYVVFRDEVLAQVVERSTQLQRGYQEHLDQLRADLERTRSQAMVERASFHRSFDQLAKRQAQLEQRHSMLGSLAGEAGLSTALPPAQDLAPALRGSAGPVPANASSSGAGQRTPSQGADLGRPLDPALKRLALDLDRMEEAQAQILLAFQKRLQERRTALIGLHQDLGLRPRSRDDGASGLGGPFIPFTPPAGSAFERRLGDLLGARAELVRLERAIDRLPVRAPVPGDADVASGFGTRIDPFLRVPAFHAGLDFEARHGEPVRATGAGRVVSAGQNGGYGLMVEIDHGDGLSTRFGHLSALDVAEGATVQPGQVIGRVGSTGRSTGPHLHYETRVRGEAVNPARFLAAGRRLAALRATLP